MLRGTFPQRVRCSKNCSDGGAACHWSPVMPVAAGHGRARWWVDVGGWRMRGQLHRLCVESLQIICASSRQLSAPKSGGARPLRSGIRDHLTAQL